MTARERAAEALTTGDVVASWDGEGANSAWRMPDRDEIEHILARLEAAGLRVIDEPEAPYDLVAGEPVWIGDGFAITAKPDGEIEVVVADDAHPGNGGATYVFEREIAAAISAAHIRAEDYR